MKFSLYALEEHVAIDWDVDEVTFHGPKGQTNILPGHAPLVSTLSVGELSCIKSDDKKVHRFAVSHGFIQIQEDEIVACGYTIERPEAIDVNRAKQAKQRAVEKLKGLIESEEEFKKHELKLQRAVIRQHLAKKD